MPARRLTQEEIMALPQEVRSALANKMRAMTPSAEDAAQQARLQAVREENPTLSALFPRMAEQFAQGKEPSFGQSFATAVTGDIPSMVGRTASALGEAGYSALQGKDFEEIGRQYMQTLQSPEGRNLVESIIKDPATPIAAALGPAVLPLAKTGLLGAIGAGLIEGTAIGASRQAERYGSDKDFDASQFAIDVGTSTMMPIVGQAFKMAAKPLKDKMMAIAKDKINPLLKGIASELSGISRETLETASTKQGRQKLIEMAGKTNEIGDQLLDVLDNIDEHYKFNSQINLALADMPEISTVNVVKSLEDDLAKLKSGLKTGPKVQAADAIENQVKALKELPDKISAVDFRNMRKDLDYAVNFEKEGSDLINDALKRARTQAKEDLIGAAKGTDYAKDMADYSRILQARDDLYQIIGKRSDVRERRIEGFLNNLFGKNKTAQQKVVKNLSDILGDDLFEQTKLSTLANEIVKEGKIPVFASQTTGRTLRGDIGTGAQIGLGLMTGQPTLVATGLGTGALSSPSFAPRILGATRMASQIPGQTMQGLGGLLSNPYLQRTIPALTRNQIQMGLAGEQ